MKLVGLKWTTLLAAAGYLGLSVAAYGTPINGTLQVAGSVTVGENELDFTGPQLGVLGALNTGSFAGFNMAGNPTGTTPIAITDLMGPPISGAITQNNFITFGGTYLSGASLNLTLVSPGSDGSAGCSALQSAAAVGDLCTPPNSPFNLEDVQDSSIMTTVAPGTPCKENPTNNGPTAVNCATAITFLFSGTVMSPQGDPGIFNATFSTQTPAGTSSVANPETFQDILAALEGNGGTGTVSESFSGVITVTSAPEPGTEWMLIAGVLMLGIGMAGKRSRALRSQQE